jgi:hypothetical protein
MGRIKNFITRGVAAATASRSLRRGRTVVAAALALTFCVQETAWATCTLLDYPKSLPITTVPGNWVPRGTFSAPAGALFIHDNSTVENGFPTHGGHWWVSDSDGFCRMGLDATGHWVVPVGKPANLCLRNNDQPGQADYDAARQIVYVPGRKTSVWRVQLADNANGSGKEIINFGEVRPAVSPLPEGSGWSAAAINDTGTFLYAVSRNNPNVWACINPFDATLKTVTCKHIANGIDNRKVLGASYNHVTHSLWLAETINLSEFPNIDSCFALTTPCHGTITEITFFALLFHPNSVLSFGRFLYVGDDTGRVVQSNLDTIPALDPNAGRFLTYTSGMGGVVTGLGADPVDGLQIFADPLLPNTHFNAQVTREVLCPATP